MMKKYLLFCFILFSISTSAQMNPQWINRFCCFDSIAPHSFSYPYGSVVSNDSLIMAYYEDDTLKIKIVDMVSGNDLTTFSYASHQILPAFNFGGDFRKCDGGFVIIEPVMTNGDYNLVFEKITNSFLIDSIGSLSSSQDKPTKFLSRGDTSFYISYLNDSLHLVNVNTSTNTIQNFSYEKVCSDIYPEMYFNSAGNIILIERSATSATTFLIEVKEIDPISGIVLQSSGIPAPGFYHKCFASMDSLFVAYNDVNGMGTVKFLSLSMISLNWSVETIVGNDFYPLIDFSINNSGDKFYLETYGSLVQFNLDHTFGFFINLPSRTIDIYNQSKILFDSNDNPIVFYSYLNNTIVNEDLVVLRIDRNTGYTIDSLVYNDPRNTPDIAVSQFFDKQNKLNLVFANDYDDAFILQEESQLNIIHLDALTNNVNEIPEANSIYPNPSSKKIFFKQNSTQFSEIKLYDLRGKIVKIFNENISGGLDIENISPGIYILKTELTGGKAKNYKVVII